MTAVVEHFKNIYCYKWLSLCLHMKYMRYQLRFTAASAVTHRVIGWVSDKTEIPHLSLTWIEMRNRRPLFSFFLFSNPSLYILLLSQSSYDRGAASWHLLSPSVPSTPAPSLWRLGTFFPTSGCIVVASPHAVTRVTSKWRAPPQLQPVRSRTLLQFVIIIKGLTPEASLPLFTPPITTLTTPLVPHGWAQLKATLGILKESRGKAGWQKLPTEEHVYCLISCFLCYHAFALSSLQT